MNREEAAQMMTALLKEHGLWEQGWRFAWMNRMRTLGLCKYGPKELLLSVAYVDRHDREHVEQTCRHEIAHALTPGAKHGPEWQAVAIQLGVVDPKPCTEADMPEGRWVAEHSCGKRYSKHRKPKAPTGGRFYYCPPCWKGLSYLPKDERIAAAAITFVDTVAPVVVSMPEKRVSAPVSASQAAPAQTLASTDESAPKTFSAPEVAAAMGVPAKNFRAWLRKWAVGRNFQQSAGGSYVFTAEDVKKIVAAWNATH